MCLLDWMRVCRCRVPNRTRYPRAASILVAREGGRKLIPCQRLQLLDRKLAESARRFTEQLSQQDERNAAGADALSQRVEAHCAALQTQLELVASRPCACVAVARRSSNLGDATRQAINKHGEQVAEQLATSEAEQRRQLQDAVSTVTADVQRSGHQLTAQASVQRAQLEAVRRRDS